MTVLEGAVDALAASFAVDDRTQTRTDVSAYVSMFMVFFGAAVYSGSVIERNLSSPAGFLDSYSTRPNVESKAAGMLH